MTEIEDVVDRAVNKVNSMSREEREEFEKSIPDPLRKLFEDAYVPMKPKRNMPVNVTHAKAVISLTSWKARINTVHKTIENLIEVCNRPREFLICLTLSTEEFPNKEADLPESLLKWKDEIEIIWVKKNVKAFKKVFYALLRFPTLPVISADDDCIYTENYAEKLYQSWLSCEKLHQIHGYAVDKGSWPCQFPCGPATLYPPGCFHLFGVQCLSDKILESANDDLYYGALAYYLRIPFVCVSERKPFTFHDENEPIHANVQQLIAARNVCLSEVQRQLGGKI